MQNWQANPLVDIRCELGEGPLWHPVDQKLYWVDILSKRLHRFDLESKLHEMRDFPIQISALAPLKEGGLVIGTEESILKYNFDDQISLELTKLEAHIQTNRTNDGKPGPLGQFWLGTMSKSASPKQGTLYCIRPDLSFYPVVENTTISNGIAWSNDHKTMYYIDSPEKKVVAFDFDNLSGRVSKKRDVIDFTHEDGVPDGMTIDQEGLLWIAHWGDFKVGRWDPTSGDMVAYVELPVPQVSCPTFGGPNLDTLFITSAWEHMGTEERKKYPLSGAIFSVKLPHRGNPSYYFGS